MKYVRWGGRFCHYSKGTQMLDVMFWPVCTVVGGVLMYAFGRMLGHVLWNLFEEYTP